jgi:hypothetical protein
MADPVAHPPVAGITAPALPTMRADQVLPTIFTIDNVSAEQMAQGTMQARLVVTRDHVIVGEGLLDGGSRGPADAGESTDVFMKSPLTACGADGSRLFTGGANGQPLVTGDGGPMPAGDYSITVLVDATPLGGSTPVTAVGGPFALTLTAAAALPSTADPLDQYFSCGEAPTVGERSLPDVAGLMLAADVPADGWGALGQSWSALLTGADERTVNGSVTDPLQLVFVGGDGRVAGMTVTGANTSVAFSVSSGKPTTIDGAWEPNRCDGTALATATPAMPAGTYTAWPVARVTVSGVTHPDGTHDAAPQGDRIVVGMPTQVTFTG